MRDTNLRHVSTSIAVTGPLPPTGKEQAVVRRERMREGRERGGQGMRERKKWVRSRKGRKEGRKEGTTQQIDTANADVLNDKVGQCRTNS